MSSFPISSTGGGMSSVAAVASPTQTPTQVAARGNCVVCSTNRIPGNRCDHGHATILGEGTYGQVFLCCLPDGTSFVEKVLKMDASVTHQREIQCLSQCRHPNIVRLISASNTPVGGRVTVRMEHCAGGDLFSLIQQRRASGCLFHPDEVMSYITQLLLAVQYLHSQSILHRDIKTSNLFLTHDRQILKLGDFGCSLKSDISISEDQRRTLCGTWSNVAPELLSVDQSQKAEYGRKAEVWSIGVVMYELLTLHAPFECNVEDAASFHSMLGRIATGQFPPIPSSYGYPPDVVALCSWMLTVDKNERPFVRGILQRPVCIAASKRWLESAAALSPEERRQVENQMQLVQEPQQHVVIFQEECYRVRSSSSEIIPAEVRITDNGQLHFRDRSSRKSAGEWNVCTLQSCKVEVDDFEEADGKTFYGLCIRPKKLNPITLGYYNSEQRGVLQVEVLRQRDIVQSC